MLKKLSKTDVEAVAVEFAKGIIANDVNIDANELVTKSYNLAISWLENEKLKDDILEQNYPNWIDLRAVNRYSAKEQHRLDGLNKHYWFVKSIRNNDGSEDFVVDKGEFYSARHDDNDDDIITYKFIDSDNQEVLALFALNTKDGENFDENFKPVPPSPYRLTKKPSFYATV